MHKDVDIDRTIARRLGNTYTYTDRTDLLLLSLLHAARY